MMETYHLGALPGATVPTSNSLVKAAVPLHSKREALMARVDDHRAVGSPASDTGRYRHSACDNTEIFNKGAILPLCSNASCPNKGANWVLKEKSLSEVTPVP